MGRMQFTPRNLKITENRSGKEHIKSQFIISKIMGNTLYCKKNFLIILNLNRTITLTSNDINLIP